MEKIAINILLLSVLMSLAVLLMPVSVSAETDTAPTVMYKLINHDCICERMIYALRGIRPNEYNAKCAEVNVINRAIELGIDVRGGSISTSYVGAPKHGMEHTPCDVCAEVIDFFEIIYNGGW